MTNGVSRWPVTCEMAPTGRRRHLSSRAGWRSQGGVAELSHPVGGAGRFVGAVFIREDSSRLTTQLWRCLLIASLGLVGFGGVGFFVSTAWQRLVSNPLSELARAVAEVRKTKDY